MRPFLISVAFACALQGCVFDPPGECSTAADCLGGARCDQGVCVLGCEQDPHCSEWESCNLGIHRCEPRAGRCSSDSNCAFYEDCNAEHVCQIVADACTVPADCDEWESCTSNFCVVSAGRCNSTLDCGGLWGTCDADHRCTSTPPGGNDVALLGTLQEGLGGVNALSPVNAPHNITVGFEWNPFGRYAFRPNGQLVYTRELEQTSGGSLQFELRIFSAEPFRRQDGRWNYPENPIQNDTLLPSPGCDGKNGPYEILIQGGTGEIAYRCNNSDNIWYRVSGGVLVDDQTPLAWNVTGDVLAELSFGPGYELVRSNGARAPVTGLPTGWSLFEARANGDGFWLALRSQEQPYPQQLWRVDSATAVATFQIQYAAPGDELGTAGFWALLDTTGSLYMMHLDSEDKIVRYPADGSPVVLVYDEEGEPSNDFTSSSLNFFNFIHGSELIRGP